MSELAVRTDKVKALSVGKFIVCRTGLILDGSPSWQEWEAFIAGVEGVHTCIQWVIGDALSLTDIQYGEAASQLTANFPEHDYDALRDYMYVSKHVEFATRTASLSWSHHRLVAKLDREDQVYFLSEAVENGWTVRDLRKELVDSDHDENCTCPICGDEHKDKR